MPRASTARTAATRPDPIPSHDGTSTGREHDATRPVLSRCVGDPGHFAQHCWGRTPHRHRAGEEFADVLTLTAVDELLTSAVRRPEVRLMRAGEAIDAASWCTTLRLGGRQVGDVVDPASVGRALLDGATVVLQSLHRTVPTVGRFAAALEAEISHPVQVNAYLTPSGAAGLAPHSDSHDVLAVQLHGSKVWTVDGLGELELATGDVLYVPAGTRHSAATQDRSSLHLTVGIIRTTYRAVLDRLLRGDAALDAPLPLGFAVEGAVPQLEHELAAALVRAGEVLRHADVGAVARSERQRRRPRIRHEGHLASIVGLDTLDRATCVRIRSGPPPSISEEPDGGLRLDLGDRVLHLPSAAGPSLRALLIGQPVAVGDLPALDDDSQVVLVRRLVREGMLMIVDAP